MNVRLSSQWIDSSDELAVLDAARSHDVNAMRAALHAIDPSINIP